MIALLLIAQLQPLPPQLIALESDEGRRLLTESTANRDFFALVGTFQQQQAQAVCGLASSATVLNAMPLRAPEVHGMNPWRAFTQDNLFDADARAAINRGGATLDQLAGLLRTSGVDARAVHANETTLDAFRAEAAKNLAAADDYLLVNFLRSELGQDVGAHWSPLGAYHAGSDRFLVMDVNRYRYPPYWAKAEDLFRAMNTSDSDSGELRGYIAVARAKGAPGREPVPTVAHRLLRFVALAALGVFALGFAAGALVMRRRQFTPREP